jgi:glycosyltransferase involved in cell wall biosynthesis
MKVSYVLYNERPMSGIIRSQVMDLLFEIGRNSDKTEITLICFWQPLLYLFQYKKFKTMNSICNSHGIRIKNYFICPPNRLIFKNKYFFKLLSKWIGIFLKKTLIESDIIHTRAYYSGFFVSQIRKPKNLRHIFDPRSIYPDEMVSSNQITKNSKKYQFWKEIEKEILNDAYSVVVVSKEMGEMLNNFYRHKKIIYIPICFNKNILNNQLLNKKYMSDLLQIESSFVIGYCGSLSKDFNNNIYLYIKYFKFLINAVDDLHILIITQSNVRKVLIDSDLPASRYTIVNTDNFSLASLLNFCDAGIFVMEPGEERKTRLGIKFVEYLALGLPVIVNANVGSALRIISENNFGINIELKDYKQDTLLLKSFLHSIKNINANSIRSFAYENFELNKISKQYISLYQTSMSA